MIKLHQINEDVVMENTENETMGNDGKKSLINKR